MVYPVCCNASQVVEEEIKRWEERARETLPAPTLMLHSSGARPKTPPFAASSASAINVKLQVEMSQKHLTDMITLRVCHLVCENSYRQAGSTVQGSSTGRLCSRSQTAALGKSGFQLEQEIKTTGSASGATNYHISIPDPG